MELKVVEDILKENKVDSFKVTSDGLIAVHSGTPINKRWKYYQYNAKDKKFMLNGTTLRFSE